MATMAVDGDFSVSTTTPFPGNMSNYTLEDLKVLVPAAILSISVYSVLLFFGLIGNLVVFTTLLRSRYRKSSRVNKLILHLAIADLIVCCFTIPIEIGWRITVTWDAGDLACRVLQFSRPFGLYLSSNTIICISLDRYFAIVQPLKLKDATKRGRLMIFLAWLIAAISSAPQAVIFTVGFGEVIELPGVIVTDCLSTEFFESQGPISEAIYNVCSICLMYFLPLVVTVAAYARILWAISTTRRLKATSQNNPDPVSGALFSHVQQTEKSAMLAVTVATDSPRSTCTQANVRFRQARQTDLSKIERARSRTLKLTILIVTVFIVCFTPYAVMVLWYQIDKASAKGLDQSLQESLFLFAVSNSIINPYLYGIYSKSLRKEVSRSFFFRTLRNCFGPKNLYGGSFSYEPDQLRIKQGNVQLEGAPRVQPWTSQLQPTRSVEGSELIANGQKRFFTHLPNQSDHKLCCGQYLSATESSQKSLVSERSHSSANPAKTRRVAAAYKFSPCSKSNNIKRDAASFD